MPGDSFAHRAHNLAASFSPNEKFNVLRPGKRDQDAHPGFRSAIEKPARRQVINPDEIDPEFAHLGEVAPDLLRGAEVIAVRVGFEWTVGHTLDEKLALAFKEKLGEGSDAERRRLTHEELFLVQAARGRKAFAGARTGIRASTGRISLATLRSSSVDCSDVNAAATLKNSGSAFVTTHWSIVLEAQGEAPAAQEALEILCRTYWRPIFSFLQRQGFKPSEAEDITQGFFASLFERGSLKAVRKEKGRLRSYLLRALKYFLADERRRAMAIKRGKGLRLIPLEELRANERIEMEPADPLTAEMIYERRWASTVLERVLSRLKDEYRAAGNAALFDSLKQLLPDEPGAPSRVEIAAQFGMTENALRQAFYRFRQRCQSLLREEIAHTVANPGDIEDELRHLIAVTKG